MFFFKNKSFEELFHRALQAASVPEHEILQESDAKKKIWLESAKKAFPIGKKIKVITSDEEHFIGKTGKVVGYELGRSGSWPLVRIQLESGETDGFYENEIQRI